jgi:hypothetical protein
LGVVTGLLRRLIAGIDEFADRPADPGVLTGRRTRRDRSHQAVDPLVADEPVTQRQAEDELARIRAEQRRRMRGGFGRASSD